MNNCPICHRPMDADNSNEHHLIPKLKGGKKESDNMVRLHVICHNKLHSIWNENELRDYYNTIENIMTDERMQKFARWVSKKDPSYNDKNRMQAGHKRRKK